MDDLTSLTDSYLEAKAVISLGRTHAKGGGLWCGAPRCRGP